MSDRWADVEPILREKAYRTMDNDPQILLATDSGFDLAADLFFARLYGLDEEIVKDGVQLRRVEPMVLLPVVSSVRTMFSDAVAPGPLRRATYNLQSGHVVHTVDAMYAPQGVSLRPDMTFRVAYLRYRRAL